MAADDSIRAEFERELKRLENEASRYDMQRQVSEAKLKAEQKRRAASERESEYEVHVAAKKTASLKTWLAAASVVATAVAGIGQWAMGQVQKSAAEAAEAAKHEDKVDEAIEALEKKAASHGRKIQRLGELQVEQQVQLTESTRYIIDRIDKAHPKSVDAAPVPEAVKAAGEKVDKLKRERKVQRLFDGTQDPADPFAGIDEGDG